MKKTLSGSKYVVIEGPIFGGPAAPSAPALIRPWSKGLPSPQKQALSTDSYLGDFIW